MDVEAFHDGGIGTSSECLKTIVCGLVTSDAASANQLSLLGGIGEWKLGAVGGAVEGIRFPIDG